MVIALALFAPPLTGEELSAPPCWEPHTPTAQSQPVAKLQTPIEISNVVTPEFVAQASHGQVSAHIRNTLNQSFEGFAQFGDDVEQITSTRLNFTLGPLQEFDVMVEYEVAENATVGFHTATFEINVGGFSFLFHQYQLEVVYVAAITSFTPAQVFIQDQVGLLLAVIENRANQPVDVRLELQSPNFDDATQEVTLSPGTNMIALAIRHEATHVYDFGLYPVNLTMYYLDEAIANAVTTVPVDMTLLNKVLGVILPVAIFEGLVIFYAYRRRQRLLAS